MERIVIRHLSGSRANQEDEFPLDQFREITLGRDPSSSVRFSEETEAMVSRRHARITRNSALPSLFFITDLNSINGTFVNQQRIFGAATLKPGDVVQCGIGGPEFLFYVKPETGRLKAVAQPRPAANPSERARAQESAANAGALNVPAEPSARSRALVVGGVLIGLITLAAAYAGYRRFRSNDSGGTAKTVVTPGQTASPDAGVEKYGHVHLSGAAAEAEKDAKRAAWRIEVAPYLTLGSGRPGYGASDFNRPAGLAFSPTGSLFAVDTGNRRVQIWDVKTGSRLAEFSHDIFGGEIAGIAIAPDNQFLITDRARGLAYAFAPSQPGDAAGASNKPGAYDFQFKGVRFGDQGFTNLSGVAIDSKGRVYIADGNSNDILRFNLDGAPDRTWKFEKTRAGGGAYLRGCDGIAIDEDGGDLFAASERDAVVEVFDWETGAHKNRTVGAGRDASGKPLGKSVFFGSVRGLAVARRKLLAVDESAGHIHVFDLALPDAFNTDLIGYAEPQPVRGAGYQGFFGHAPLFDFEDRTNAELQRQVKSGAIIPGQTNPPGYFCSPGAIASYTDGASGETYIAVADQCNHRIVVYRWSDIAKALGVVETPPGATLATNEAGKDTKIAIVPAAKPLAAIRKKPVAAIRKKTAPGRGRVATANRRQQNRKTGQYKNSRQNERRSNRPRRDLLRQE